MREAQTAQARQTRLTALQQIQAAAGNPDRAVALWEEAVRAVQFDGAPKENSAFKDWKDKEGDVLNSREGKNAVRLQLMWLGITMQRDAGVTVKDLLPQVVAYTKELQADQQMMEALDESIKREKEAAPSARKANQQRKTSDEQIKKVHDQILSKAVGTNVVAQWMKLGDLANPQKWESNAASFDGIFNSIVLPEFREQKDPRLLEYWDVRLKRETDAAAKSKLAFDTEKFNTLKRPTLLWNRTEDILLLGQKNRALSEMFAIIKAYPTHPDAANWMTKLENLLAPAAPATAAPAAPAAQP